MVTESKQTISLPEEERAIRENKKEKIIVVLDASIKAGRDFNWWYENLGENHRVFKDVKNLRELIEKKKGIFEKLDTQSFLFERILDTAKLALKNLKDYNEYNYYSAELINKFLSLEEIFLEKKLKSVEVKTVEKEPSQYREPKAYVEPKAGERQEGDIMIPKGMTGEGLVRQEELKALKEEELEESLDLLDELDEEEEDNGDTPPEPEEQENTDELLDNL